MNSYAFHWSAIAALCLLLCGWTSPHECSHAPLPAEITSFSGTCDDGIVRLSWTTRTETHTDVFRIEASADGRQWSRLGTVEGAGESNRRISYRFVLPAHSGPYYRLVVVDRDGQEYLHPSIEVRCVQQGLRLRVTPNPATDRFEVKVEGLSDVVPARLEILDAQGRLHVVSPLFSENGQWTRTYSAQALQLPAGKYTVRIRQDGKMAKAELVVE